MPQLNVKGIKRVNEFADPEIIEQTEVTTFENYVLDKEGGKAVKGEHIKAIILITRVVV